MTISQINDYVSFRGNTNTTEYSSANRLISTNRHYHKVATMILDSMDDWDFDDSNKSDYPIATTDLVANQQDYIFPTGLLRIKRVEANLDGTWRKLEPLDINQRGKATDTTTISNDFNTSSPFYDVEFGSLKLYPIPSSNVTAGLKIWYVREPTEFTAGEVTTGTKEPGFDEPFHIMIALGMCFDWFTAKDKDDRRAASVKLELDDYEQRLRRYYGSKKQDTPFALGAAYQDYN